MLVKISVVLSRFVIRIQRSLSRCELALVGLSVRFPLFFFLFFAGLN